MHNTLTIAKRELQSYFNSPIAYIVIVAFLGVAGWMYFSSLFLIGRADMRTFFQPSPFSPSMLLVIIAPALTMRLIAEERKSGTIELLTTLPIRDTDVIVGKFLAALGLIGLALGLTLFYPISVSSIGSLDWGPVLSGYLGMFLFSAALLGVGILCSTFTDNQIVAFIVGFLICAALYFVFWLPVFMPDLIKDFVHFMSVSFHLDNMARGVVDSRDIFYYLTLTGGTLYLAVFSLGRQHA
ncbi:MAG: ABC transporter [Deltaproteobacteria bacterium RIFOXYA12_FULL_58_15]|nr:MAG: ABC transporter [Deltaproteobacteria bacterium RIFOXYA12_FULL_58_15]OGR14022.1 MAG: ABC transporter [Deltaproteobacteria bacterium RIFOXYB12_FULL_58_9]